MSAINHVFQHHRPEADIAQTKIAATLNHSVHIQAKGVDLCFSLFAMKSGYLPPQ